MPNPEIWYIKKANIVQREYCSDTLYYNTEHQNSCRNIGGGGNKLGECSRPNSDISRNFPRPAHYWTHVKVGRYIKRQNSVDIYVYCICQIKKIENWNFLYRNENLNNWLWKTWAKKRFSLKDTESIRHIIII